MRCVDTTLSLGAFAPGWAPSELVHLALVEADPTLGDHVAAVELVLRRKGGDIWGTVVDPSGAPVKGAYVAVGTASIFDMDYVSGHYLAGPKPQVAQSDEEGCFRINGVTEGVQPLAAWHSDWPIWRAGIDVVAGTQHRVDVDLVPGVTVSGVVNLASGEPAPGAAVMALTERFEDAFPSQGPYEEGSPFAHPRTETDENGKFELGPITPGEVHMYASLGAAALTDWTGEEPTYQGTYQETLSGASGQEIEWNPTLSLGLVIAGVAKFADGTPKGRVFVIANDGEGGDYSVNANMGGEFSITGLKKKPYRVTLQMPPNAPRTASIGALYEVIPPAGDLELVADYTPAARVPRGKLRVRLRDTAKLGQALGKGPVVLAVRHLDTYTWGYLKENEDGVMEESYRPGQYFLTLEAGDLVFFHGEVFDIRSGEILDLGTIETQPPDSLEVTVRRPEGVHGPVFVRPRYYVADGKELGAEMETAKFEAIATGKLQLTISGEGVAQETIEVEVLPGIENRVGIDLRRAARVQIDCTLEQPRGYRGIALKVTDASGTTWFERFRRELRVREWPFSNEVSLPPGTYTVELEASDGQSAVMSVTVDPLAGDLTVRVQGK